MPAPEMRISVAMTTYQGEAFVEAQLESILAQSRLPDEIVIGDDASTDSTWDILTHFAENSPVPVRLHRSRRNMGLNRNIERVVADCQGSVLVFADQDDLWAPDKLAAISEAFAKPEVVLWFSDADLVDSRGIPTGDTLWEWTNFSAEEQQEMATGNGLSRLLHGSTVTGATMAVSAEIARLAIPLPSQMEAPRRVFLHDGWMAVLASVRGRIVVEPRLLTSYRRHPQQFTEQNPPDFARRLAGSGSTRWAEYVERHDARVALDHARVRLVTQRLRDAGVLEVCRPSAVEEVLGLEELLDVRVLRRGAQGRRRQVATQVVNGGYRRYARGLRTAIGDILCAEFDSGAAR